MEVFISTGWMIRWIYVFRENVSHIRCFQCWSVYQVIAKQVILIYGHSGQSMERCFIFFVAFSVNVTKLCIMLVQYAVSCHKYAFIADEFINVNCEFMNEKQRPMENINSLQISPLLEFKFSIIGFVMEVFCLLKM